MKYKTVNLMHAFFLGPRWRASSWTCRLGSGKAGEFSSSMNRARLNVTFCLLVCMLTQHIQVSLNHSHQSLSRDSPDQANALSVKSELRYPIIQAIRSQWESQDLPTLRAISTMWRMTRHLRNKGTTCVHRIRDKGTGFDHRGHSLMTADG